MIELGGIDIEFIALLGGALWLVCGCYIGVKSPERIPREFALLFALMSTLGAGFGVTIFFPPAETRFLLFFAVVLYVVLPPSITSYLLWAFPKDKPPSKPRGLGKRHE